MVKTPPSNAGGVSLVPCWRAKIPHGLWPKNQNIKQKQYCNKFNKDFKNGPRQKRNLKKILICKFHHPCWLYVYWLVSLLVIGLIALFCKSSNFSLNAICYELCSWLFGFCYLPFSSVQLLSRVWLFVTPWIAACQASLSITNSRSSFKLMSIESVMPSSHLILLFNRQLHYLPSAWFLRLNFQLCYEGSKWIFTLELI